MIDIIGLKKYKGFIKVKSVEELQDLADFCIKEVNSEDRELTEEEITGASKVIETYGFMFIDFSGEFYMLEDRRVIYDLYNEGIISYIDYDDIIWEIDVYNFADFVQEAPYGLYEANLGYVTLMVDKRKDGLILCKDEEYPEEETQFLSDIFSIQEMFDMSFELMGEGEHLE